MGQYWMPVNLEKREYINPHKLGCGLKLWEQAANHPGTAAALIVLLAAMPEPRGGGDFDMEDNWHGPERTFPEHNASPGPMPEPYPEIAKRTIGRWAGNQVVLLGDYAERSDLPAHCEADIIYSACQSPKEVRASIAWYRKNKDLDKAKRLERLGAFTDITADVRAVLEHELGGKFDDGTYGFAQWKPNKE